MRALTVAALLAMTMLGGCATTPSQPAWQAELDALVSAQERACSPGFAVGVVRDGRLVYSRGVGLANVETGQRIDARSNFRLASVTKQLTAAAILTLYEDGKLAPHDTLGEVLPGFPAYANDITMEQLVVHRSGLVDYEDLIPEGQTRQLTDADVLAMLKAQPKAMFAAGERFHYSNSGYVLLGLIIEARSGMSFAEYLDSRIFAPLGMRETRSYGGESAVIPHRAYGYTVADNTASRTDQSTTSALLGDGGVYSSLHDMARWVASLENDKILSAASRQRQFTAVPVPETPGVGYGYGFFIDRINGHERTWHTGSSIGFRHKLLRFPERDLTVLVLGNINQGGTPDLADRIAGIIDPELRVDPATAPKRPVTR